MCNWHEENESHKVVWVQKEWYLERQLWVWYSKCFIKCLWDTEMVKSRSSPFKSLWGCTVWNSLHMFSNYLPQILFQNRHGASHIYFLTYHFQMDRDFTISILQINCKLNVLKVTQRKRRDSWPTALFPKPKCSP